MFKTYSSSSSLVITSRWFATSRLLRHNDHDGVSNHQPHSCLLNRLFRRRSKKTSKLRVTGLCVGNSPGPVNSPHKGPVTRKMFPFDDVIMCSDLTTWQLLLARRHFVGPISVAVPEFIFYMKWSNPAFWLFSWWFPACKWDPIFMSLSIAQFKYNTFAYEVIRID